MPTKEYVRERLIRIIREKAPAAITRRELEHRLVGCGYNRETVRGEISLLLSQNYIARLGAPRHDDKGNVIGYGKRGDPERFIISGGWPADKCPLCGSLITLETQ